MYTKERYKQIAKLLKEIASELKTNTESEIDVESVIDYVLNRERKILGINSNVSFTFPDKEKLIMAATFQPVTENKTFQSFLNSIDSQFYDVWDSNVRTGYLTGMTSQQIVRNVLGTQAKNAKVAEEGAIHALRNSLIANTRTALQSFANATRNEIYEKNADLFSDYKWLATLDRRTCTVCGSLDGKTFKNINDAPTAPIHLNCRCLLIANVKGIDFSDERASENGYVDSKTTYSEWLKEQPDKVQREVLGSARYKMYKNGTSFDTFVNNKNQKLTLKELEDMV
ncbi:MAG: minor capsid protein [Fibrobacter sp.]|nr:minor capsid protein [Fibrobacter sp.]